MLLISQLFICIYLINMKTMGEEMDDNIPKILILLDIVYSCYSFHPETLY